MLSQWLFLFHRWSQPALLFAWYLPAVWFPLILSCVCAGFFLVFFGSWFSLVFELPFQSEKEWLVPCHVRFSKLLLKNWAVSIIVWEIFVLTLLSTRSNSWERDLGVTGFCSASGLSCAELPDHFPCGAWYWIQTTEPSDWCGIAGCPSVHGMEEKPAPYLPK